MIVVAPLVCIFAALSVGSAELADVLILPPAPGAPPPAARGANEPRPRFIPFGPDHRIEVFIARSPGAATAAPLAFVLRFTGGDAAGAAVFTASRWRNRPVEVWVANYPGYGGSSGRRSLTRLAPAALATFDQLSRVADGRPI